MVFKIEWIGFHIETASRQYLNAATAAFANLPSEMDGDVFEIVEDAVEVAVEDAFDGASEFVFDYDDGGDFVAFDWLHDATRREQRVIKIWYEAAHMSTESLDNA